MKAKVLFVALALAGTVVATTDSAAGGTESARAPLPIVALPGVPQGLHRQGHRVRRYVTSFDVRLLLVRIRAGTTAVCDIDLFTPHFLNRELLLSGKYPCLLRFEYLLRINSAQYRGGWRERLNDVRKGDIQKGEQTIVEPEIERICDVLPPSIAEGDVLELEWKTANRDPSVLFVRYNGATRGAFGKRQFVATYKTLLGDVGPQHVRSALFAGAPLSK